MTRAKIKNTIVAISEGLLGKLLFNSKIDIAEAYTEYMLYEPIVQIAKRNWKVESEVSVESLKKKGRGDSPKIDFVLTDPENYNRCIALEVKYAKGVKSKISVDSDIRKLLAFKNDMSSKDTKAFLMIFWKEHANRDKHLNHIANIKHKVYHEWKLETNLK
jgi:hypothetical protein